jgi:hypothetical protein
MDDALSRKGGEVMEVKRFNKALLVPILSGIVFYVKLGLGYELPSEFVDVTANFILAGVQLAGLFMDPKK